MQCVVTHALMEVTVFFMNSVIVRRLAVPEVARSGPGNVLMKMYGIDSTAIVKAVKEIVKA